MKEVFYEWKGGKVRKIEVYGPDDTRRELATQSEFAKIHRKFLIKKRKK